MKEPKRCSAKWYSDVINRQTWVRIQLSLAAYAYEVYANPIMSDHEFDKLALEVDLSIDTRRPDLDVFFRREFQPHTGSWIWAHPDRQQIGWLLEQYWRRI